MYLTSLIEKQDKKIIDLENSCDALKKYKHMIKSCSNMDCKGCNRGFTPSLFSAHIVICKKIERKGFTVQVSELVKVIGDHNTAHYEFKMLVNYSGLSWFVFKRYKQFFSLHQKLRLTMPGQQELLDLLVFEDKDREKKLTHEEKKSIGAKRLAFLQEYVFQVSQIQGIELNEAF